MAEKFYLFCILTLNVLINAQNYGPEQQQQPVYSQYSPNSNATIFGTSLASEIPATKSANTSINMDYLNSISPPSGEVGNGSRVSLSSVPQVVVNTPQAVAPQPAATAERRTFDFLSGGGGGGGGDGYGGGSYGGGSYGGGGGGGGAGGVISGALTSILTPLAGAAAAALTAGGGASLISLPNANIQPTLQKTFVVNMGGNNPPLIVQGNAYQPGASAGSSVASSGSGKSYGGGGGHGGGSYGGGGSSGRRNYHSYPPSPVPAASSQVSQMAQSRGYNQYPNSPTLPQVAAKLGLANLLNMAKQSGFLENLLIGGPFTFFAPSDEAFTKLPKIFLDQAAKRPELAKQILLYHIVPDTITTRHFTNDLLLPTLNTKKLRINLYQLGYKKIATVNGGVIIRPDQYIINGVIHVIDRVLFPVANGTILSIVNGPNCQPFDVISTVLAIAGLYDKLQEPGPFTVFLPDTQAFGAVPAEERDKLLQNQTLVREAFLYHIVPGTYYGQGLQDGQWLETLSSFGVPVQIGMVSDGYTRRFDSVNGAVRIVKADIPAENGVIHIVDKILTPFQTYLPCLQDAV